MEKQKKILISHPTGNSNVRGAVDGFFKRGILHTFHTSVSCFRGNIFHLLSKFPPFREFRKRAFSEPLRSRTHNYPFMELGRMVATKFGIKEWLTHESGRFCIDRVYRDIDSRVASFVEQKSDDFDAVYCYEDCAAKTFDVAQKMGKRRIFDLPIGYWRAMHRLLEAEQNIRPEWAMTLGGFNDSCEKLDCKDMELALANKIYVASSFTKETLKDFPGELADVEVIPYGFPPANDEREFKPFDGRKIKLLFVGSLSQRKGIANIFEAIEGLEDRVEFTIVGRGDTEGCAALKDALSRVTYIPALPHDEVLRLMSTQDLFLFPSLFEGFGLVITEAMSQGTPAITTNRTCGEDVITHGVNGWIVEAGNSESLRAQILTLIDDPQKIAEAGAEAIKTAKQRPWSLYEEELSASVTKYLENV
ncbi:MAG: glycosyltransferase family 4 protein [Rikenellaceae bacterium]